MRFTIKLWVISAGIAGAWGCQKDEKVTIPTKLIEPSGPEGDGGSGGEMKSKRKAEKQ